MKTFIYLFLFILVTLFSCEIDDSGIDANYLAIPTFDNNEYNRDISSLSYSISEALKVSKEFRLIVKNENLRKFDGDYNVLLSQILDISLSDVSLTDVQLKSGDYSIKDLLEEFYMAPNADSSSLRNVNSNYSFIDDLLEKYPLLQIAMPVHAETWDCETIPVVTFIPSDFVEGFTKSVIGYTADGDTIAIDAETPPGYPVVVISLNERIEESEISKIIKRSPVAPSTFTGSASSTGILLTWNYSGNDSDQLILEKNDGNGYTAIATLTGNQRDYLDNQNIVYGTTYFYRIKATNYEGSIYSNTISVTFINKPSAPSNFEIVNYKPGQIFLSWVNTFSNPTGTVTKIERFIPGISTEWQNVASLSIWENSYYDLNLTYFAYPNNRYQYRIFYDSGARGKSDASYDVDYNSLRASGEPLYLTTIYIPNLGDIESWLQGAPDFFYTVATMNTASESPVKLKDKQFYRPSVRSSHYKPNIELLGNWDKLFAQSIMSVNLVEDDADGLSSKINIIASVKKAVKSKIAGDISVGAGGEVTMEFHAVDKNIGTEFVYYWENLEVTRSYGYGIDITFSNVPVDDRR